MRDSCRRGNAGCALDTDRARSCVCVVMSLCTLCTLVLVGLLRRNCCVTVFLFSWNVFVPFSCAHAHVIASTFRCQLQHLPRNNACARAGPQEKNAKKKGGALPITPEAHSGKHFIHPQISRIRGPPNERTTRASKGHPLHANSRVTAMQATATVRAVRCPVVHHQLEDASGCPDSFIQIRNARNAFCLTTHLTRQTLALVN